jgi:hypothetical protein
MPQVSGLKTVVSRKNHAVPNSSTPSFSFGRSTARLHHALPAVRAASLPFLLLLRRQHGLPIPLSGHRLLPLQSHCPLFLFHATVSRSHSLTCCIEQAVSTPSWPGLLRRSPWKVLRRPHRLIDAGAVWGGAVVLALLELHLVCSGPGLFERLEWTGSPIPGGIRSRFLKRQLQDLRVASSRANGVPVLFARVLASVFPEKQGAPLLE